MLTGKTIDLELVGRTELGLLHRWVNDVDFVGEFEPLDQVSLASLQKDCTGIGYMPSPRNAAAGTARKRSS
jgi:hypothetical protein